MFPVHEGAVSDEASRIYREWWRSLPWWKRLAKTITWRARTVWAGLIGKPTPGEVLILNLWKNERERRREHDAQSTD